jgi:hypothetical protein
VAGKGVAGAFRALVAAKGLERVLPIKRTAFESWTLDEAGTMATRTTGVASWIVPITNTA